VARKAKKPAKRARKKVTKTARKKATKAKARKGAARAGGDDVQGHMLLRWKAVGK
jgi:hypothetical protein